MAPTRTTALLLAALGVLGLALLASLGAAANPPGAVAAATDCSGVTLTPASRTVKRGGRVLVEGTACGASSSSAGTSVVHLRLKKGKRWANLASATAGADGSFSVCAKVSVPRRARVAKLQATASSGATGSTTLRLAPKGASNCEAPGSGSTDEPVSGGGYHPPPPETGNPDCPLSQPDSTISLVLPSSCTQVASDTASSSNPLPFWGRLDCASADRHQQITSGGDAHSTGNGTSQGDTAFRRLSAVDGDDVWGERCEMGLNDNQVGPTTFYHEGQRRVTFASIRLPNNSPISDPDWRVVLQMKQAQPYYDPNPASMFTLEARDGRWHVGSSWNGVWSTPATQNTWTRFAFDIVYSQDPSIGSIKTYVDLNGDGDANDANEQSPRAQLATLRAESGSGGPIPTGQSIPSHLRAGIYQNSNYPCSSGCSVDIDNVQVFKP